MPELVEQIFLAQDVPFLVQVADFQNVDHLYGHLLLRAFVQRQVDAAKRSLSQVLQHLVVFKLWLLLVFVVGLGLV